MMYSHSDKNEYLLGTWAEIPSPYVSHIMMTAGFDFSIIDMEHGIIDFETAQNMIFAAHSLNKKAYVRVPAIEESWTLRVLDTGCDGIIFPQVSTENQVKDIIRFSRFSPAGERGFNPYITAGGYSRVKDSYYDSENSRIQLGIILEGKKAFDDIDRLLSFDEIGIVYIGQYDLSMALGIPGRVNDPLVLEMMENAAERIRQSGKLAGCMVHSTEEAIEVIRKGFQFVVYQVDTGILCNTIKSFVEEVKGHETL